MAMNTCFSFVVSPLFFPIKVKPRIVRCDPGKEVVWEGKRFGIHAVHAFRFKDLGTRVVVESEEAFDGFLAAFSRLFGLPERLHRLTTRFMNSLKKASESCRYSPGQGRRGHE
jgi:hypothetical protein